MKSGTLRVTSSKPHAARWPTSRSGFSAAALLRRAIAAASPSAALATPTPPSSCTKAWASSARAVGLTAALAVGLFGGSILVPLAFISDEIGAVPSFGAASWQHGLAAVLFGVTQGAPLSKHASPRLTFIAGCVAGRNALIFIEC